jgi:integral membrane sensor domain MASE1
MPSTQESSKGRTHWNDFFPEADTSTLKNLARIAIVALAYLIAARLSLFLAFEKTNASPVWPPSGIAFAALVLWGPKIWPGVWIGAFVANLLTFHSNFQSVSPSLFLVSIGIAAGNSLEGLAGYFLLRHWVKGRMG